MAAARGIIVSSLSSLNAFHKLSISQNALPSVLTQVRHYAARKGTREKAKKKKVKHEVKKLTFEEKVKRSKKLTIVKPDALIYFDDQKTVAIDDVYFQRYFKYKLFPFVEAIQCHREHMHPTMFNAPDSVVNLNIELNMQGIKKTRTIDSFSKMVPIKHQFDHGEERKVLVFCKSEEEVKDALDGGAALAGGADIVKLIVSGEVSLHNYDTVIAHPNMMPELLTIRGLLKKKHPNIKAGTLGADLKQMLYTQIHGIKYRAKPYDSFPAYGKAEIPIGRLNMDVEHLEENLQAAVDSVMSAKPRRPGPFITRIRVECPPSKEFIVIDHKLYTKEVDEDPESNAKNYDVDEEDDNAVAVSV